MATPPNGLRATPSVRVKNAVIQLPVDEGHPTSRKSNSWPKLVSSMSFSMAVHAILLLILSWIYFDLPNPRIVESILSLVISDQAPLGDSIEMDVQAPADETLELVEAAPEITLEPIVQPDEVSPLESVTIDSQMTPGLDRVRSVAPTVPPPKKAAVTKSTKSSKEASSNAVVVAEVEGQNPEHFIGRTVKGKTALLKRMGGTDASEAAVARGLVWLKKHQLTDGSWSFNHQFDPRCDCTMPGRYDNNPFAATALALMAFLGAGQTHESGEYQHEVQYALDFLVANGIRAPKGIGFYGNLSGSQTFYTHGLVTIALSEAVAMTGDGRLRPAVTGAVDFLVATQATGGGWRYFPGQPGDTSVVAWELMALKSAQFSRIPVPQKVFKGIDRFMVSVSSQRGTQYAYTPERREAPTPSMTAAGLLCRMYLDWDENKAKLRSGVQVLDQFGPDPRDMYYNYYATQVMHHWGGPEWDRWNNVMREHLIHTQILEGHATGSWDVADRHGYAGGRVYMTSLALLTLEVYYRHLPLYRKDRVEIPLIKDETEVKRP